MKIDNFPTKMYKCILVDPPWEYKNRNTGGSMDSSAMSKYDTMTIDDIKSLPIYDIAMKDCCLFMWCTTPLLDVGFEVMRKWGFEYKTCFYWIKKGTLGMGFWFRGQVEVCLIGIKGDIKPFNLQIPNYMEEKVRVHSQKPDRMYRIIESLNLNPKIELFARERREGWDAWEIRCLIVVKCYFKKRW